MHAAWISRLNMIVEKLGFGAGHCGSFGDTHVVITPRLRPYNYEGLRVWDADSGGQGTWQPPSKDPRSATAKAITLQVWSSARLAEVCKFDSPAAYESRESRVPPAPNVIDSR